MFNFHGPSVPPNSIYKPRAHPTPTAATKLFERKTKTQSIMLTTIDDTTFKTFFLRLPNPGVSSRGIGTGPRRVPSFYSDPPSSSSSLSSSPYSSPLSSTSSRGSGTGSYPSSRSTSQHSSPSSLRHAYASASGSPLNPHSLPFIPGGMILGAQERMQQTGRGWDNAKKTYGSGQGPSFSGPGTNTGTNDLSYLTDPDTDSNYPWIQFLDQASKIRDRRTPENDTLIQSLARAVVDSQLSSSSNTNTNTNGTDHSRGWTESDLYPLTRQLIWIACKPSTLNCERDSIAYFCGWLMFAFDQKLGAEACSKFVNVLEMYAKRLFGGCWDAKTSIWALKHPAPAHITTSIPFRTRETYIMCSINLCSFIGYLYQLQILPPDIFSKCLYTLISGLCSSEHLIAIRELLVSSGATFPEAHKNECRKELERGCEGLNERNYSMRRVNLDLKGLMKDVFRAFEGGVVPPHMHKYMQR
ncbi:hypothetical protein VKT23_006036 [Stygiomarasmius scandens]|uniref:Uncharacterized protein n=1 Tax=Marasmiellus scandens TaxID=2682957 RepID=A0ABR1JP10_9AGAR